MGYTIDGHDLWSTYGVKVLRVRGHLDFLERKGELEYSWPDSDGVEAFTGSDDIHFKERVIHVQCVLIAGSIDLFYQNLNSLKHLLESSGTHILGLPYTSETYTVYYPGGDTVEPPKNYNASMLYSKFTLKFIESSPPRATTPS